MRALILVALLFACPTVSSAEESATGIKSLYISSIVLQSYDTYQTLNLLQAGGYREANPLMQPAARHPAAFVAVKAAGTSLSIYAAHRLWKDNHKTAAIATMIAVNGFLTVVAARNARFMR